jgi:hypothetical protein
VINDILGASQQDIIVMDGEDSTTEQEAETGEDAIADEPELQRNKKEVNKATCLDREM